ncbi:DMT family transporter [Corticibacterium sp. UT-5YL-CI-8]|nr:DMT family transporter [Tianweitania sp. UT-5YL-CI-8]
MKTIIKPSEGWSLAALVLAGIIIGLSPIFVRLSDIGPIGTAFWRVTLAMLPLLVWRTAEDRTEQADQQPRSLRDVLAMVTPGAMLAGDLLTWHISIHITSVANATLLANLAPIFVVLGGWLLFGNTVSRTFIAGLALAIAGVTILNLGVASGGAGNLRGDAIAVVAAMFYGGYVLSLSRLRSRYTTLTTLLWSTGSAALCLLPFALVFEPSIWPLTLYAWAVVIALAWICHIGGQGLIIYALALLPASFSSLTLLIQPVVAAFVAWLLLNETISLFQALGGVVVIAGILVARRG